MSWPTAQSGWSETDPWSSTIADGSTWTYGVLLVLGSFLLAGLGRALLRLPTKAARDRRVRHRQSLPRRLAARLHEESGTATVEFVLVFGPALMICLILLQTVLLFSANFFIYYAAYAATRSAIVNVPTGQIGGGGSLATGDDAFESAQNAAALALTPISGRSNGGAGTLSGFTDGLNQMFGEYGAAPPNWIARLAADRLAYAQAHTDLSLLEFRPGANGGIDLARSASGRVAYGPKDPVSLGVAHRLHLSIPFASMIFADGQHETVGGTTAYTNVYATCTLTLEGYDRNLPPPPTDGRGRILERSP